MSAAEAKAAEGGSEPPANLIEKKKIKAAWEIFDRDRKKVLPKDDVLCIMQYLAAYPAEDEWLHDILPQLQDDDPAQQASIKYDRFEPFMIKVLVEKLYEPDSEETLLQAFKVFDPDGKRFIDEATMTELLTDNPWAFREKEIESFMAFAKDAETGTIYYEDYIENLASS